MEKVDKKASNWPFLNILTSNLTLKVLITSAAVDILIFLFVLFREKRLDVSYESSARQIIHMKCQILFFLKKKEENNA